MRPYDAPELGTGDIERHRHTVLIHFGSPVGTQYGIAPVEDEKKRGWWRR